MENFKIKINSKSESKEVKEYINKITGEYRKTDEKVTGNQWVEIPDLDFNYAVVDSKHDILFSITESSMQYLKSLPTFICLIWQRDKNHSVEVEKKHSHYFKDVSHLNQIDVYDILKLFEVTDPCLQHIVKKALCAGKRGHKDLTTDLQNILDTAIRAVELNK